MFGLEFEWRGGWMFSPLCGLCILCGFNSLPSKVVPCGDRSKTVRLLTVYKHSWVCDAYGMKTAEHVAGVVSRAEHAPVSAPMPFALGLDEMSGLNADAPIEPPPPAKRRVLKGRLLHRGRSQPIPITDPWE